MTISQRLPSYSTSMQQSRNQKGTSSSSTMRTSSEAAVLVRICHKAALTTAADPAALVKCHDTKIVNQFNCAKLQLAQLYSCCISHCQFAIIIICSMPRCPDFTRLDWN